MFPAHHAMLRIMRTDTVYDGWNMRSTHPKGSCKRKLTPCDPQKAPRRARNITSLIGKRNTLRSGTQFRPFYVQFDLLLTITIQSLLLSYILSSIPSSSSSSISRVITFVVHLFFNFLFDTSASAFSTTSRISFILKTNFPVIATRFLFLCSLRTRKSSLYSAFSFYRRATSDTVLSKAAPDYLIYRFTGVSRVDERTIEFTSKVASCNSVPSSGELSSREQSRSVRVVIGGRVVGGVEVGIRRVEKIVISESR
jgi:hypothetical protein